MSVTIYSLVDPLSDQVRYVGKTVDPSGRLGSHVRAARHKRAHGKRTNHKDNWLLSLDELGLRPGFVILEATDDSNWADRERYWITQFNDLTNLALGGEGPHGIKRSAETRAKLSEIRKKIVGWKHTEETKAKIGNAHRGRVNGPMSEETKKKISAAKMGKVFTKEHRRKISEAQIGRVVSEETRQKISNGLIERGKK